MNARLYDPVLGRMLNPDNYIANPLSIGDYNRYTYAKNNPMAYTDPDGNSPLVAAMFIGGTMGGAKYTVSCMFSFQGLDAWRFSEFNAQVTQGVISGAISYGIGNAFQPVLSASTGFWGTIGGKVTALTLKASVHSATNLMQTQNIKSALSNGGSNLLAGMLQLAGTPEYLQGTASILSGGVISEINGGKFSEGIFWASMGYFTNNALHEYENNRQQRKLYSTSKYFAKYGLADGLGAQASRRLYYNGTFITNDKGNQELYLTVSVNDITCPYEVEYVGTIELYDQNNNLISSKKTTSYFDKTNLLYDHSRIPLKSVTFGNISSGKIYIVNFLVTARFYDSSCNYFTGYNFKYKNLKSIITK